MTRMIRVCAWCGRSLDLRSWWVRLWRLGSPRLDREYTHGICQLCRLALAARIHAASDSWVFRLAGRYFATGARAAMSRRAGDDQ